jgi:hypothetical protein
MLKVHYSQAPLSFHQGLLLAANLPLCKEQYKNATEAKQHEILVYGANLRNTLNCSLVHRKIRISVIPVQPKKFSKVSRGKLHITKAGNNIFKTLSTGYRQLLWTFLI